MPYQEGQNRPKVAPRRPKAAKDSRKAAKDDPEVANDAPNATSKPPKTPKRPPEPRSCSHSGLHLPTQTHEICGFTYGKRMIPKSRLFRLRGPQMKPRASKKRFKSLTKHPKGSQKGPPRRPNDPTGRPKGARRMPIGDFLEPQGPQMPPKVVPKAAEGRPRALESAKGPILDDFCLLLGTQTVPNASPQSFKNPSGALSSFWRARSTTQRTHRTLGGGGVAQPLSISGFTLRKRGFAVNHPFSNNPPKNAL